jgi:adenylate cyclase
LNAARLAAGRNEFRIGIGLHLGEIIFGNVGAVDRLDFTAIGPAVNLACRLETLTKRLGRPLLLSRDFAGACRSPLVSLGFHPVKGLSEPEEVFGLADHAPAL